MGLLPRYKKGKGSNMKNSQWEEVVNGEDEDDEWGTHRMKVAGGWMVNHWVSPKTTKNCSTSLAFLPDAKHAWEI